MRRRQRQRGREFRRLGPVCLAAGALGLIANYDAGAQSAGSLPEGQQQFSVGLFHTTKLTHTYLIYRQISVDGGAGPDVVEPITDPNEQLDHTNAIANFQVVGPGSPSVDKQFLPIGQYLESDGLIGGVWLPLEKITADSDIGKGIDFSNAFPGVTPTLSEGQIVDALSSGDTATLAAFFDQVAATTNLKLGVVGTIVNFSTSTFGGAAVVTEQSPLDCSKVLPSSLQLWPPDHTFSAISITGVVDSVGNPASTFVPLVLQDEPTLGFGSGNTCPDAIGQGAIGVQLRAERDGRGDGRVYHVPFLATSGDGVSASSCGGEVRVCVPHNQGDSPQCVDEGPLFDSSSCP